MPFEERIDIHAHFIPPFYRTACEETGHGKPDGMPAIPPWTEEAHLGLMKELSITKSIVSISSPGVYLVPGDTAASRQLVRQCNEFASDLCKRRPQEFGFFASVPLPDVDGSLAEIPYALDTLGAAGVALETNHHGTYLGDAAFDAVFQELNRRHATVFIHPTTPCTYHAGHTHDNPQDHHHHHHSPITFLPQYPNPMFEFLFDTTRATANLFLSGTIARNPNITFILPHAGATLPPVLERISRFATSILASSAQAKITSQTVKDTFSRQFYFDLAGFPFPDQIHGLLRLVGPDRLLYGSDFPFTPREGVVGLVETMAAGLEELFRDKQVRRGIYSGNARRVLGGLN